MIDLSIGPAHDPRPLTPSGVVRLVVAATTAVAVQVSVLDPVTAPVLRHLDLPLGLAAALVLARPGHSVAIGLIFGVMVDASSQRLFGLHTIAYATLGPVAVHLPTPAWHRSSLMVLWRAGVQGLAAATVVAVGRIVAAGTLVPGVVAGVLQTGALVGLVAMVASRSSGGDAPFRHRGRRPMGRAGRPGPRLGAIRPLSP